MNSKEFNLGYQQALQDCLKEVSLVFHGIRPDLHEPYRFLWHTEITRLLKSLMRDSRSMNKGEDGN